MSVDKPVPVGLIGCGGFGRFCLEAYADMPEVAVTAVADIDAATMQQAARKFGIPRQMSPEELIGSPAVELVHIATPPHTHHAYALSAIRAGKHVLCEKPLALDMAQAEEMLSAAAAAGKILPVDFVIRYVPLVDVFKAVIQKKVLGEPLRATLENYATDTHLPPEHWFWDKAKSGGIFIEHGVHFFDLYRYWLGDGEVLQAHAEIRPGTAQEDRVTCWLRHENGVLTSHYHGFDQPERLDRTTHRLVCERGEIVVEGWIPLKVTLRGLMSKEQFLEAQGLYPEMAAEFKPLDREGPVPVTGRGKTAAVDGEVKIEFTISEEKKAVYAEAFRSLVRDQLAYLSDPQHRRKITETNGRQALDLAVAATRLASN